VWAWGCNLVSGFVQSVFTRERMADRAGGIVVGLAVSPVLEPAEGAFLCEA